ncbi:hypothetical protein AQ619_07285 [Caulobacter henricii]|uniref:Uncharacterized protein n=1 Tax=Caulobacter henricii TaxID=69395 RepID=A0A0P0NYD9_9CAUL|nr:hypothetical protein AQ619_07285 [Caulobacter henricii]
MLPSQSARRKHLARDSQAPVLTQFRKHVGYDADGLSIHGGNALDIQQIQASSHSGRQAQLAHKRVSRRVTIMCGYARYVT